MQLQWKCNALRALEWSYSLRCCAALLCSLLLGLISPLPSLALSLLQSFDVTVSFVVVPDFSVVSEIFGLALARYLFSPNRFHVPPNSV